jgi:hypothetical protein
MGDRELSKTQDDTEKLAIRVLSTGGPQTFDSWGRCDAHGMMDDREG